MGHGTKCGSRVKKLLPDSLPFSEGRARLCANAWEQERCWRQAEKACQAAPRAQRDRVLGADGLVPSPALMWVWRSVLQLGCLPRGAETRGRDEWELRFGVAGLGLAAREQGGGAGRGDQCSRGEGALCMLRH